MNSRVAFVPETPFVQANTGAIEAIFTELTADFPNHTAVVDGASYTTSEALHIDDNGELAAPARRWLWKNAQGFQHGYDRGVGDKVYIPHGHDGYMKLLGEIAYGNYNLVEGGQPEGGVVDKNLLVTCGFPQLNGGRLRTGIDGDFDSLWEVNSVMMLSGQRPRWSDSPSENTGDTVIEQTATALGLDLHNPSDLRLIGQWQAKSPFAREQAALPEGAKWQQIYATEALESRVALELALMKVPDMFDWDDYHVQTHLDPDAQEFPWAGEVVPARMERAWEYRTTDNRSLWVINAAAFPRTTTSGKPSEARPNGEQVTREAYHMLGESWRTHENLITTGAPHIRLGIDSAIGMMVVSKGDIAPLHLAVKRWESHEPPVTGIAQIVSTYKADLRIRALLNGGSPDAPELRNL